MRTIPFTSPSFTLLVQFTSHPLTKFHATCSIHVSPPHQVSRFLFNSRLTCSPNLMLFITRCTVNFDHGESHPTLFTIRYHSITSQPLHYPLSFNHILPSSLSAIIQSHPTPFTIRYHSITQRHTRPARDIPVQRTTSKHINGVRFEVVNSVVDED